jgi:hypothetical protein
VGLSIRSVEEGVYYWRNGATPNRHFKIIGTVEIDHIDAPAQSVAAGLKVQPAIGKLSADALVIVDKRLLTDGPSSDRVPRECRTGDERHRIACIRCYP